MRMTTTYKKVLHCMLYCFILLAAFFYHSDVDAATTVTKSQAISWVKTQASNSKKFGTGECVDFTEEYFKYIGATPFSCDAYKYATTPLPTGWTRVKGGTPQSGDILVYVASGSNPYGHTAIYNSDYETYHQNFNGKRYVSKVTYKYNSISPSYWGYIRPNWKVAATATKTTVVTKFKLSNTKKTIKKGKSFSLTVTLPTGSKIKTTTNSKSKIVKVTRTATKKYKITGKKKGTSTITVKLTNGKTAKCVVKVN